MTKRSIGAIPFRVFPGKMSELWVTTFWKTNYDEHALPAWIVDDTLRVAIEFDHFEWVEGEEGGEPHSIRATSLWEQQDEQGNTRPYQLDIMFRSPAAEKLLRLGLVEGAPADAIEQLEEEDDRCA
jgi:hypothetical protein